jgi:hypothetical protein
MGLLLEGEFQEDYSDVLVVPPTDTTWAGHLGTGLT